MADGLQCGRGKGIPFVRRTEFAFDHQGPDLKDRADQAVGDPVCLQGPQRLENQQEQGCLVVVLPGDIMHHLSKIGGVTGRLHIISDLFKKILDLCFDQDIGVPAGAQAVGSEAEREGRCHDRISRAARPAGEAGDPPLFSRQQDNAPVIFPDGSAL